MNARGRQPGEAQVFNSPHRASHLPLEHTIPKSNSQFFASLLHSPGIVRQQPNLKVAAERERLLATEVIEALAEEVVEALLRVY